MYNRIGDSSNLLTASSQSEHGIRQNPCIYYRNNWGMKYLKLSVIRNALQYPPTGLSHQHWLVGTFRTPFDRDFICNNVTIHTNDINVSVLEIFGERKYV